MPLEWWDDYKSWVVVGSERVVEDRWIITSIDIVGLVEGM